MAAAGAEVAPFEPSATEEYWIRNRCRYKSTCGCNLRRDARIAKIAAIEPVTEANAPASAK